MNTPPRIAAMAALLLLLPGAARPQSSGVELVALDALAKGIAAAAVVGTAVIYMVRYHRRNITGCVETVDGITTLVDQRNQRRVALTGSSVQSGRRLHLKGIRAESEDGSLSFRVTKTSHDYGDCSPQA